MRVRAPQTAQWLEALKTTLKPGDLVLTRRYGPADDEAVEGISVPLSRAGIAAPDGQVVEAFGSVVTVLSLRDTLRESHRVVVVRPGFADGETRPRAASAALKRAGEPTMALVPAAGELGLRRASVAFVLAVFRSVEPSLASPARDPADFLDRGTLVFDSGPRH